jgi:hypothetical protein
MLVKASPSTGWTRYKADMTVRNRAGTAMFSNV